MEDFEWFSGLKEGDHGDYLEKLVRGGWNYELNPKKWLQLRGEVGEERERRRSQEMEEIVG